MIANDTKSISDENKISPEDVIAKSFSDIIIESDGIKAKSMKQDAGGINIHILRINSLLIGIRNAKLELDGKLIY